MPLYDYECKSCDLRWESLRSLADRLSERCGRCSGPAHQFLPHAPYSKRFTPHFNHQFGCVVRSPGHLNRLNKEHGLESISLDEYKKFAPDRTATPTLDAASQPTLDDYRAGLAELRIREGRDPTDDPAPDRIISDAEAAQLRAEKAVA